MDVKAKQEFWRAALSQSVPQGLLTSCKEKRGNYIIGKLGDPLIRWPKWTSSEKTEDIMCLLMWHPEKDMDHLHHVLARHAEPPSNHRTHQIGELSSTSQHKGAGGLQSSKRSALGLSVWWVCRGPAFYPQHKGERINMEEGRQGCGSVPERKQLETRQVKAPPKPGFQLVLDQQTSLEHGEQRAWWSSWLVEWGHQPSTLHISILFEWFIRTTPMYYFFNSKINKNISISKRKQKTRTAPTRQICYKSKEVRSLEWSSLCDGK